MGMHYILVREFPFGKGFADIAFIPKKYSCAIETDIL